MPSHQLRRWNSIQINSTQMLTLQLTLNSPESHRVVGWVKNAPHKALAFKNLVISWWQCLGSVGWCILVRGNMSWDSKASSFMIKSSCHFQCPSPATFSLSVLCSQLRVWAVSFLTWLPGLSLAAMPPHFWSHKPKPTLTSLSCFGHGAMTDTTTPKLERKRVVLCSLERSFPSLPFPYPSFPFFNFSPPRQGFSV